MLKLEQAVLVEGKYDAARLTNLVDATILTTDGSRVFRDKELQNMLKRIAAAQGLIILTDSDDAGFRIRHFVTGLVGAEHVLQAYVPAVHGKEARKQAPGKEGLVHISKLDDHRVEHVEDVVAVGDPIFVMVTDIDQQGRINLSRKDAIAAIAKKRAEAAQQ